MKLKGTFLKKFLNFSLAICLVTSVLCEVSAVDLELQKQLQEHVISNLLKVRSEDKKPVIYRVEQAPGKDRESDLKEKKKKHRYLETIGIEILSGFLSPFVVAGRCLEEITGGKIGNQTGIDKIEKEARDIEERQYWSRREVGQGEYVDLSEEMKFNSLGQKLFASLFSPLVGGVFIGAVSLLAFPVTVPYAVDETGKSLQRSGAYWPALMGSLLGIALSYSIEGKYDYFHAYCSSVMGSVLFYNIPSITSQIYFTRNTVAVGISQKL